MSQTTEHAAGPGAPAVGPDPLIGKTIDGCKMVRKIGQGGMGVVYLAHQESQSADVCIKILNPSLVGSEDTVERFFREAQACAQLTHPSIVAIQNVGQDGEYYFIRMEYIDGATLEELVRQKEKLDWKKATEYALATAEALAHAHQKGMIHRDIKPENIMLTAASEEVKVMDFGLAKHVHSSAKVSVTGQIVGTPFFMSPEQAGGKPTDARSDIYSLGVTLYYLVTGVKPFNGKNLQEIFLKHFFYAPESPKIYNPALPESLCDVIRKCLKKKKKERYQSAKALANDLRAVLADPNAKVGDEGAGASRGHDDDEGASGTGPAGEASDLGDKTVRAGGPGAEGEKTVRVGGEAEVESRTVKVGGEAEGRTVKVGGTEGEQPTVAVKGNGAAPGKRKKDVAQVQFRSASMVLDGKAVEKLEIDDEEDDPTRGVDMPTVGIPGLEKPKDAEQEKALAELQRGPTDKKKLVAVALVLLIPVLAYFGLMFAARTKLGQLQAKYEIVKTDPDALAALTAEVEEFMGGALVGGSVKAEAETLKQTCDAQMANARAAREEELRLKAEREKLEAKQKAEELERAQKLARWDGEEKKLAGLNEKADWAGYTEQALMMVKEFGDVPALKAKVDAIQVPVIVTSDPGGAELYLGDSLQKEDSTPPVGKGLVWVKPNAPVRIRVQMRGHETVEQTGTASQFLSWDVEMKRSIVRQVDLGTIEAQLGNRQVQEELIPINEPQLDNSGGLYFVGHDGRVRGVSVARDGRGQQLWGAGHEVGSYGDPVPGIKLVAEKVVIVPSLRGQLSLHDPTNGGQRIWTASFAAAVTSPPAYSQPNGVIAVGLETGEVVFLTDKIGQEEWRFATENAVVTAPFFLGQNLVFVGSTDDRVYAVDWRAQKPLGQLDVGGDVVVGPLPFGRHLVVGTATGAVCVIDPLDPERLRLVARADLGGPDPARKAPIRGLAVEGEMVYATIGSQLRAVRVSRQGSVTEAWQRPYASSSRLTAPTAADGVVYVGAQDGALAALDGRTGDLLWRYRTEGRGGIRHPVIVLDAELYVITGNKVTVLKAE